MKQNNRIEWIELLRVFAIFQVIMCHIVENTYRMNTEYIPSKLSPQSEVFMFSAFTLGRLGVPFFLMISGYLLLDRTYDFKRTKRFWKNNWLHLLVCTELWFIIYEIYMKFYLKEEIGIFRVLTDLLFVNFLGMGHVWYMPMILGMYILIPFAANALRSFHVKHLAFPLIFYSLFVFGYSLLNTVNGAVGTESLGLQMSLGFSGGSYGIYMMIGYVVRKGAFKNVKSRVLLILAALSFTAGIGLQIWAYANNYQYNIWYDCPFILFTSVPVFELFSRIRHVPAYSVVKWLAYYSFAVYLIHMLFRDMINKWITTLTFIQPVKVMLFWLLVTVLSYLAAWLLSRIPKIGKYMLYLK